MDKGSSNADDIGLVIVGRMGEEMGRAEKKEKWGKKTEREDKMG